MPVTTPEERVEDYGGDQEHFFHVLEHLLVPAVQKAGYTPLVPIVKGSTLIHAVIIERLIKSDIVLCDMSCLNANVFFEFGIRTALNKPICIVKDSITTNVPFDTSTINYHEYKSDLSPWELDKETDLISKHIIDTVDTSEGVNSLWKVFGSELKSHEKEDGSSMDLHLENISNELQEIRKNIDDKKALKIVKLQPMDVFQELADHAALSGHYLQLGECSDQRIRVFTKNNRKIGNKLIGHLNNLATSRGYRLIIDVSR